MPNDTETAVLENPATPEAELTPQVEDTDANAEDDTEGSTESGDTDDSSNLLTPEQAEKLASEKVEAALQEARALADDKAQAENYRATLQRSAQTLNVTAATQLQGVIDFVLDRVEAGDDPGTVRKSVSQRAIQGIAFGLGEAAFVDQMEQISESFRSYVAKEAPDFKPSAELVRDLERAQRALPGDQPHSQAYRRVTTEWKYLFEAAKSEAKKEAEQEVTERNKKAEATKALAKSGTNGQKPVAGGGSAVDRDPSWAEIQKMNKAQLAALPDNVLEAAMNRGR